MLFGAACQAVLLDFLSCFLQKPAESAGAGGIKKQIFDTEKNGGIPAFFEDPFLRSPEFFHRLLGAEKWIFLYRMIINPTFLRCIFFLLFLPISDEKEIFFKEKAKLLKNGEKALDFSAFGGYN